MTLPSRTQNLLIRGNFSPRLPAPPQASQEILTVHIFHMRLLRRLTTPAMPEGQWRGSGDRVG